MIYVFVRFKNSLIRYSLFEFSSLKQIQYFVLIMRNTYFGQVHSIDCGLYVRYRSNGASARMVNSLTFQTTGLFINKLLGHIRLLSCQQTLFAIRSWKEDLSTGEEINHQYTRIYVPSFSFMIPSHEIYSVVICVKTIIVHRSNEKC